MHYIYALRDPRTNQIRYIGKSDNPQRRYSLHLNDKDNCHRVHWIQELRSLNLRPIMTIIEQIPHDQDWEERERYWIKHYRDLGYPLTNGTDGGDGGPDCTGKHLVKSESGRRNIVAALVKRNKSPEMREVSRRNGKRIGARKHSPEEIERIRQYMTGRKIHTDAFRHRLIEQNKTRTYNHDSMSTSARKLWEDPVKGKQMRELLAERNRQRRGLPRVSKISSEQARENSRRLWDDPIKSANARTLLIERNKRRTHH